MTKTTTNNKVLKGYLEKLGVTKDPDALNLDRSQIPSALLLKDAEIFIDRVYQLINEEKRIVVVGDYDTDGVCSTTVLIRAVRLAAKLLGKKARISYVIPHRFEDGYGLSPKVIDKVIAKNPKVDTIITVDNGIVAFEAVSYAKAKGIEVLITDHHKAKEDGSIPEAVAVVNPNRLDDNYPFKGISGTIVVYKLFLAFAERYLPDEIDQFEAFVDFAGLSVISDVMPVLYENRIYLNDTIDILNQEGRSPRRFAWTAIIESLRRSGKLNKDSRLTEKDLGFSFSPMLNAQSRVYGVADHGIETFLSTDTTDVREKVEFLVKVNEERKRVNNAAFEKAQENDFSGQAFIVYRDDELGDGYIGLIAGKLTEHYNRPSLVLTKGHGGVLKGSARCIPGYDLFAVLSKARGLTEKMGGHSGAAGLSIKEENLAEFAKVVGGEFERIIPEDLPNRTTPDFSLDPSLVNIDFVRDMEALRPFGEGLPEPKIEVKNLNVKNVQLMGKETAGCGKPHIKYKTTSSVDVVIWSGASQLPHKVKKDQHLAVVGTLEKNYFLGQTTLQLVATPKNVRFD